MEQSKILGLPQGGQEVLRQVSGDHQSFRGYWGDQNTVETELL